MQRFHVAIVPLGKFPTDDLEPTLVRVVRAFRYPLELRAALPLPPGSVDPARGQHRAAILLERLSRDAQKLAPGRWIGGAASPSDSRRPDAHVFLMDQDLYTASSDGVIAALVSATGCGVVSVRRLREAFYNRRADPVRQRSRLVKEILRVAARLAGLPQCPDPTCALAPSRGVPDIDTKQERFCRRCEQQLFEGRLQI